MQRILLGLVSLSLVSCASSPSPAPSAPPPAYGQPQPNAPYYGPQAPYPQPQNGSPPYPQAQYPQPPYPQAQYPQPQYPQAQAPQPPYPQAQYPQAPYPQPQAPASQAPQPQAPPPATTGRPLLGPLVGAAAWQAEVRAVLAEQITTLSAQNQARVRGIPLVFDPNPFEVNAFAGCDDKGSPYLAGTEGLLEAVDAISQTHATDEMFGTRTYEQYTATVIPRLAQSDKASAALPVGIIPANLLFNMARVSRAHELFDDLVAFTFGHELAHHYLGHTGCANGQSPGVAALANLGNLITNIAPGFNQPNEVAADSAGMIDTLDTGLARSHGSPPLYRWSENGAMSLLDFFGRLERAVGLTPLNPIGFLQSHPSSAFRAPIVQAVARTWYLQHPG